MSAAYQSALDLSFDVRAGLVMRQIHHWAALLFLAAIVVHLGRVFFTGAFRRPREINWIDRRHAADPRHLQRLRRLLAARRPAVGHRAAHRVLDRAVDPAGRHVAGVAAVRRRVPRRRDIISRLYVIHILLIPAVDRRCCSAPTSAILVRQKHTQFAGPGRREDNVVGERLWPTYAAKALGLFFLTAAVLCAARRRWPRSTRSGSTARSTRPRCRRRRSPTGTWAGSTARCGSCRGWEIRAFGLEIPNPFFPGVLLPGLTFGLLYAWPFLEARVTGDHAEHHLLDRPRRRAGAHRARAARADLLHRALPRGRQRRPRRAFHIAPESITTRSGCWSSSCPSSCSS